MNRRSSIAVAWLVATLLLCGATYHWTHARALGESQSKASRQVAGFGLALQNELEKYETLPFVMSLHVQVAQALLKPAAADRVNALNLYLAEVQKRALISAAFVVDVSGLTIAASNWNQQVNFVGQNYWFRPYVQRALSGGVGRFFAIGSTTGEPGYFLAHPVFAPTPWPHANALRDDPIGVVVIKIDLEGFERYWASSDEPVVLADENGVIFLSNVPALKYRSLAPLGPEARRAIEASQQYTGHALAPLAADRGGRRPDANSVSRPVGKLGWNLMLFTRTTAADEVALHSAVAAALLASIAGLVAYSAYQRREHLRTSLMARQALSEASEQLEQRIASRTHDLVRANAELEQRYRQLQQAEQLLRQTQTELVQAGKLGMLGQMAAGMTHELNQPLAAMQAFADNAVAFIDRADVASARANLAHISDACTRMSHIIRQLKGFARKSEGSVGPVDLAQSIRNSALLVGSDYAQRGAALDIQVRQQARVVGDSVRVEQVLINLLRNALDAVEHCDEKRVRVELDAALHHAVVRIIDTGPGLAPQVRERLFEPFFTTKPSGQGMGLGLAISSSIVQAMSGELLAGNAPGGGAEFILKLPLLAAASQTEETT